MCEGKWRRRDERIDERRDELLWDLFHRETEQPPPTPVAEREEAPEPDREEALTAAPRGANQLN